MVKTIERNEETVKLSNKPLYQAFLENKQGIADALNRTSKHRDHPLTKQTVTWDHLIELCDLQREGLERGLTELDLLRRIDTESSGLPKWDHFVKLAGLRDPDTPAALQKKPAKIKQH